MKTVILAGGFGSRLSEETHVKPKPMIEIGGKPILWHILKMYSHYGLNDFIICCGYKGYVIKEYFANYFLYESDCRFDLKNNKMEILRNGVEALERHPGGHRREHDDRRPVATGQGIHRRWDVLFHLW